MARPGQSDGFTIIEALVALTILAVAVRVIFASFGTDTATLERTEKAQSAVLLAESQLAELGYGVAVRASHLTGAAGDLRWTLDIGAALTDPPPAQGLAAYPVTASVRWRDDRGPQALTLHSVRLGPAEAPP